jgi:hypothetical protein
VNAVGTGSKVPVTKENVSSISLLSKEFWFEELFSECSALMSSSAPKLITALSERIVKFESKSLLIDQRSQHFLAESLNLKIKYLLSVWPLWNWKNHSQLTIKNWRDSVHPLKQTPTPIRQELMA